MAYENTAECITLPAGADHSSNQYKCVTVASDGEVELAGAAARAIGVLQDNPDAAGKAATVGVGGVLMVMASAAIAAGAEIGCAASGKIRTAVSSDFIMGTALEAASADGNIIAVYWNPANIKA